MANIRSALKRIRSSAKKRVRNQRIRSYARTCIKKASQLIASGASDETREAVNRAISALDRAASKGVIHRNNAARRKSRLVRRLRELG